MKKSLFASLIIASMASMTVSADSWGPWGDANSNTQWNGNTANNMNNNAYMNSHSNAWGDGSSDADMDGDIEIVIKARGRGNGNGNTRGSAYGNGSANGYNNWNNRFQGDGNQRYMNNNSNYYSPPPAIRQYSPAQADEAHKRQMQAMQQEYHYQVKAAQMTAARIKAAQVIAAKTKASQATAAQMKANRAYEEIMKATADQASDIPDVITVKKSTAIITPKVETPKVEAVIIVEEKDTSTK